MEGSTSEALRNCRDLDLANTGSMYLTVPLRYHIAIQNQLVKYVNLVQEFLKTSFFHKTNARVEH